VKVTFLLAVAACPLTFAVCASTGNAVVSDAAGVKVCPCWPWSFPELVELPRCLHIHQPWEHFRYEPTKQYSFDLSPGIMDVQRKGPCPRPRVTT
jgi:hypothetical protein